jgi:hypothetical protein
MQMCAGANRLESREFSISKEKQMVKLAEINIGISH